MRTIRYFALVVLCLLPLGARAQDILKLQGVGPIHLKMKEGEVSKLLGSPKVKTKPVMSQATGMTTSEWSYPDKGLKITLGENAVQDFSINRPAIGKPRPGLAWGSSADDVRKAYAGKIDKERKGNDQIVVGTVYDGLIFTLKGGRVCKIFAGAAAE